MEILGRRLQPARSEVLLSVQLMKRKQQVNESVDAYSQDFESLFEKSYGQRTGMDQASKELLKGDLYVLGLLLKWQEKMVPSAKTFEDALHQARLAEEQGQQMSAIQRDRGYGSSSRVSNNTENNSTSSQVTTPTPRPDAKACFKCGSRHHKATQCPLDQPPAETPRRSQQSTNAIGMTVEAETLDARCTRLREELTTAEFD